MPAHIVSDCTTSVDVMAGAEVGMLPKLKPKNSVTQTENDAKLEIVTTFGRTGLGLGLGRGLVLGESEAAGLGLGGAGSAGLALVLGLGVGSTISKFSRWMPRTTIFQPSA